MNLPAPEIIAPDKCIGCGTELEVLSNEFGGFMCFPAFSVAPGGLAMIYGVVYHCCPKCGAVMINKNAVENQKKFNDSKVDSIIRPKSNLILATH